VLSGMLRDLAGWPYVWTAWAGLVLAGGIGLFMARNFFLSQVALRSP